MEALRIILLAFLFALILGLPLWLTLVEKIPSSKRKVDQENEDLRKQHNEDCKKMQEMEQYKTEGERLYNVARENLQTTFSEDVPKMLDSVITGRLNNAFESDISLRNFHAEMVSRDSKDVRTVTLTSCTCPDHINRKIPCKHMLYLAYTLGVLQVNEEETKAKYWISVQRINENAEKIKEQEKQIKKNKNTIKRQEQRIEKQKEAAKAAEKNKQIINDKERSPNGICKGQTRSRGERHERRDLCAVLFR